MAAAPSLYKASTGLCADSVESVPGCQGLFALATYQVDKHEQDQALSSSSTTTQQEEEDEGEGDKNDSSSSPAYSRRGTCSLYYASSASDAKGKMRCDKLDTIDTPAILDMKWSLTKCSTDSGKIEVRRLLGVANAKGQITLHRLQQSSASQAKLHSIGELTFNDRNALCLSLDFSDRRGGHAGGYDESRLENDTSLIVSQSDGSLAYLPSVELALSTSAPIGNLTTSFSSHAITNDKKQSGEEGADSDDDWDRTSEDERLASLQNAHLSLNTDFPKKPKGLRTWKAHDFEAWIAAFDCFSPSTTVWSGGDDLTLHGWDLRSSSSSAVPNPTFSCSKPFNGGVTSLQSHHLRQHIWAVGSYDSHLRLFDARNPARPLSETHVGGGVWRVKWHPSDASKLLVGCMHDGFKVLSLPELGGDGELRGKEMDVARRFDEHESLAYGCDWDRGSRVEKLEDGEGRKVYSCSFYDATMHIWDSATM